MLEEYRDAKPDCVLLGDLGQAGRVAELKRFDPSLSALIFLETARDTAAISILENDGFEYVARDTASSDLTFCLLKRAINHRQKQQDEIAKNDEERAFQKLLIHDLRANFRAVSQSAAMLMEDLKPEDTAELAELLAIQDRAVIRGNQIFSAVEAYRKLQDEITVEAVDLNAAVSKAVAQIAPKFCYQTSPVTQEKLPVVEGSHRELVAMFEELISNGLKFNETASPKLSVNLVDAGPETCTLAVEDNGIGVPEKFHSEIFKPLRRLWSSDVYPGAGLGLAICKRVVERHSGKIWYDPQNHEGSRFLVSLPVKQPAFSVTF